MASITPHSENDSSENPIPCSFCDLDVRTLSCPACARGKLLPVRVENANALLNKALLERDVNNALNGRSTNPFSGADPATKLSRDQTWDAIDTVRHRTEDILQRTKDLRNGMDAYKKQLDERKTAIARRRVELDSARNSLRDQSASQIDPIKKSTKKTSLRLDSLNSQIVSARAFLCREAASLAGLQRKIHRTKDGRMLETYAIGATPLADLREMNGVPPQQIATSLTNIVRLVNLACHYLHVRLPAEITLPHRQYPLPTIFALSASYQSAPPVFHGLSSSYSSNNSPRASRTIDPRQAPRPRPLFLDNRKLPILAKEDPAAYALFVEGVSLLAWDVVWLCRSQGLLIGSTDWEDFCNIGKNLWTLLIGRPSSAVPASKRISLTKSPILSPADMFHTSQTEKPTTLGLNSHGTLRNFLGTETTPGVAAVSVKEWNFASPIKLIDRVKTYLASEMSGAEWEVVKEDEYWDASDKVDDTPVVVNGRGHTKKNRSSTPSAAGASSDAGEVLSGAEEADIKARGTAGWTKLRSRSGDV